MKIRQKVTLGRKVLLFVAFAPLKRWRRIRRKTLNKSRSAGGCVAHTCTQTCTQTDAVYGRVTASSCGQGARARRFYPAGRFSPCRILPRDGKIRENARQGWQQSLLCILCIFVFALFFVSQVASADD